MAKFKRIVLALALAAGLVLVLDTGCLFRRLTGVPCPGCGMTRAFLAAFRLDFPEAFRMHPLWPLPVPVFLASMLKTGGLFGNKRRDNVFWCVALIAAVLGLYILRMALWFPDTPPMAFDHQALIPRLVQFFSSG